MRHANSPQHSFSTALKETRRALSITQEDFGLISSRTYVSSLERGKKAPTLTKVDQLASVMGIHPLTLLTMSYLKSSSAKSVSTLQAAVSQELEVIFRASGNN